MGGLGGIMGLLRQNGMPPSIEDSASQAPQQLGQALQNQQQAPAQAPQQAQQPDSSQPQQPAQQPDSLDQLKDSLVQQYKANQPPPPSGGPVRHLLQNFFSGMGNGMMTEAGLPTPQDKQNRLLTQIQGVTAAQSNVELHKAMAGQFGTTQMQMPDGSTVGVQNKDVGKVLEGQIRQQTMEKLGLTPITAEMAQANPKLASLVGQVMTKPALDAFTKQNVADTKATSATDVAGIRGDNQALDRQQKLDMFKQTQQYRVWKEGQDNQTKLQVAQMSGNKAPAAIMQTAAFAQGGLNMLNDAKSAMSRLESRGVLGNVASNKIEDWIFGKGLVDPTLPAQDKEDIGRLRAAANYTSSAAMRAHTGRSSREIYDDFKNTMGINQGPDAWKGAMDETQNMLSQYASGATDAAIANLRGRSAPSAPGTPSSGQGNAGNPLSVDDARGYLLKAGGDKNKARALAKADGRSF